ncbi:MAG: OmpA family protein [Opitutales bacterium]|nr:OmpA family protein [Opitutales bacterium]
MNVTKIALLAAAALIFAGCGPKSHPNSWRGAPQTGTEVSSVPEEISGEDESLTGEVLDETDARDDSPAGDKVANWISSNNIPESAKLAVIYFGFDKFNVEAGERAKLDAIIDAVNRGNVYIVGYSDYFGTEEYNLALSDKRAQAVKNYLKNLGADDSAQIQALGEAYAVQNGTKSEVAEDRKVIVVDGNAQ